MGEVHALRIKSPYKLLHVEDIKIINKPNEHGTLYLKCLVDDSINFKYSIEASTKDEIIVYEEKDSKNNNLEVDINKIDESKSIVLFNGLIKSIKTTNENGIYYVEIEGISKTSELDIKEKSRSFQNINMTYNEIIASVLKDYSKKEFIQSVGCGQKINKPIFQHQETDWNFLKRICSQLNSEIYCDIISINNLFYFGINEGKFYELKDHIAYKACKDLKAFHKAGGYEEDYHDTDYFYYEINSREKYYLGDNIYFKQKDVYVTEYAACKYQDEIIYKYRLCRKNGVWQTKLYNSLICGASLEGKVLAVQGEQVKLKLNIDKEQNESEVGWFKYAPPTGNTMYSMPTAGTSARLYFPDESGNEPLVSGCIRNNGSSCAKTSDTTKRYFGTEHGSEVEMTPSALNIRGGSSTPISISIDDNVGITITSPKKLTLNADSEIIMKTPKNVKINGVSQVNAQKTNTESGFSLETDLHFLSNNVIKNGSCEESYPDFDDEPEEGQMPEPPAEKKKGFGWGSLLVAAIAAVAVVAAVVTFGVGAVLIGAAIGAAISVASTAACDAITGNKSSLGTYLKNAFVGAVSGAIFGPFGAFESIGGIMAFGGIGGMADSLLNQAVTGNFSLGQTLFDGLIGAATGGLLHGMGKLASKVAPYLKNGIGKVLGKLSSGAKSILNKVSGKLDDVLGAFSKTSKELFSKVANKVDDVLQSIKSSAHDLVDRLSGKFNEITSRIDDKIDDALHSMAGKADDALNSINEWTDRVGYNIKKSLGLQEEYAGIGAVYIPPEKITPIKNLISKMDNSSSGNTFSTVESIINGEAKVPTNKQGFDQWFDSLTPDECNQLWADPAIKKTIKDRLRDGNNHEWYKVSNANTSKRWGLTAEEIKYDAVTEINTNNSNDLWFVDIQDGDGNIISGRHGDGLKALESTHTSVENSASSYAHKELDNLFDTSANKSDYLRLLNEWADNHLISTVKDAGYSNEGNIVATGRDVLPDCIRLSRE